VTAREYAENLEDNLSDLYERLRSGRYIAPPVERAWIDEGNKKRGIEQADLRG
jgi:retron-type reverse transcriptase